LASGYADQATQVQIFPNGLSQIWRGFAYDIAHA